MEATIREAEQLANSEHESIQFQNRYRCKDGTFRWLAWQAKNLPGAPKIIATARDVTEQHLQLEALRESESRFRTLANHATFGIAQADVKGNTTYVNQRLCDILGALPEELMGLNWQGKFHPSDREAFLDIWREHTRTGRDMPTQEVRMLTKEESFRWVNCSMALVKNAEGVVESQIATVEDVHSRKVSEQRLHTIFAQSPVGIALLDSHSGRFIEVNPKSLEILGRTQDEVMATDFQSVTHPDDLQQNLDNIALLRAGKIQQFRMEKRYLRPDGKINWANLTVVPLWQPGEKPSNYLAIVDDITERKQAEAKLQTREAQLAGLLEYSSNMNGT